MKSALNRVLTLPDYRSRRELSNRTGIMDLQNKNNILVAKQVSYGILVPMLYIICREHTCIHPWGWHLHGFRAGGGVGIIFFDIFIFPTQSTISNHSKKNKIPARQNRPGGGTPTDTSTRASLSVVVNFLITDYIA